MPLLLRRRQGARELFLAFDAVTSALEQAEAREAQAQLAVATLLSAARPAQDALM